MFSIIMGLSWDILNFNLIIINLLMRIFQYNLSIVAQSIFLSIKVLKIKYVLKIYIIQGSLKIRIFDYPLKKLRL